MTAKSTITQNDIAALDAQARNDVLELLTSESEECAYERAYELEISAAMQLGFDGCNDNEEICNAALDAQTHYWRSMRAALKARESELSPGALAYLRTIEANTDVR
mgnify:CR=1 FL=1